MTDTITLEEQLEKARSELDDANETIAHCRRVLALCAFAHFGQLPVGAQPIPKSAITFIGLKRAIWGCFD